MLKDQDSGFRNRAIKYSLKTRQLILGYIGSTKIYKTIGTQPRTLRQPWVSVNLSEEEKNLRRSKIGRGRGRFDRGQRLNGFS